MHEAFELDLFVKLLLNDNKGLWIDGFKLDFRKILYPQAKSGFVFANAFDWMRNQHLLGRQRVVGSGADFGQQQVIMSKRNRVTISRDVNPQFVLFTFDRATCTDIEKLWMHVPREQMKIQICNFRPRG